MLETLLILFILLIFCFAFADKIRKVESNSIGASREIDKLIQDLVMCRVLQEDKTEQESTGQIG